MKGAADYMVLSFETFKKCLLTGKARMISQFKEEHPLLYGQYQRKLQEQTDRKRRVRA